MKIEICSWDDVKFIPETYNTEYATFTKRKKQEVWFKATSEGQIVGCGCLLIMSKSSVRLSNIFVIPSHRGRGIAQELVKGRELWAKAQGFKTIDTRTVKRYYLNHGYKEIKQYKVGGSWFRKELL